MRDTPKSQYSANSLASRMRKLSGLSRRDWWVLVCSSLLVSTVWASLRMFGLPRTLEWAAAPRPSRQSSDSLALLPASLGRLVNVAARYGPIRAACLVRSLVLIRILSGRGVAGTLQIGVRKGASSQLDAHAWVECHGIPVNDHPNVARDFAVFDTLDNSIVGALL